MKKIVTIVGPSGSGKSTLEAKLVNLASYYGNNISKCVSHTSRSPRQGEIEGKDYYFVDVEFFKNNKSDFIEYVEFGNSTYGLHKDSISDGLNILVAEPSGYNQIMEHFGDNVIGIKLETSNSRHRMIDRGDKISDIDKRLEFDDIEERSKDLEFNISINTDLLTEIEVFEYIIGHLNEFL